MKSLLFWDVTHHRLVFNYGHFETNYQVVSSRTKQSKILESGTDKTFRNVVGRFFKHITFAVTVYIRNK